MTSAFPEATSKISKEEADDIERFSRNIFSAVALARRMKELEVAMPDASVAERLAVFYSEYPPAPD